MCLKWTRDDEMRMLTLGIIKIGVYYHGNQDCIQNVGVLNAKNL